MGQATTSRAIRVSACIVTLLAGTLVAAPAVAHATTGTVPHTQHGCPAYALCIYKRGGGWQGDTPIHWAYPAASTSGQRVVRSYNLSGMYGTHRVFNNGAYSYDGPHVNLEEGYLNTGYNGTGKSYYIAPGHIVDVRDMGPWNSVTLIHKAWTT